MSTIAPATGSSPVRSRKAPLRITSAEDIRNYIQPTVRVYNPTDWQESVEMMGEWYTFKPKSETVLPHKMRYLTTLDKNPMAAAVVTLWEEPKKLVASSEELAALICGDDVRGQKGFTVLIDDGQDDERRDQADARWIEWRLADARAREAGYVAICVEIARANPGSKPPRMRLDVKQALLWLEKYEAGEFRVSAAAARDAAEEQKLLIRRNPELAKQMASVEPSATSRTQEQEARAATGGVLVNPVIGAGAITAREVMTKAKELRVKLSGEEVEALYEGSPKVQAAVIKRLAQVAAKRARPATTAK